MASGKDSKPGVGAPRRLGRGLSSLLSAPVQIEVPIRPTGVSIPPGSSPTQIPAGGVPGGASGMDGTAHLSANVSGDASAAARLVEPVGDGGDDAGRGGQGVVDDGLERVQMIAVDAVRPNASQPRQDFDEEAIGRLAESIRAAGLMQPILVRPWRSTVGGALDAGSQVGFELIAGERRWRAMKLLGSTHIPAIVREVGDDDAAVLALIENLHREDLNPMERAEGLLRLVDEFGLTHLQVAERTGLDRSTVTNLLRLNEADAGMKSGLREGKLSFGHAKVLLGLTDESVREFVAGACAREGWSVRELERHVRALEAAEAAQEMEGGDRLEGGFAERTMTGRGPIAAGGGWETGRAGGRDAHLGDLERKLGEHLGTRVRIERGKSGNDGRLIITFYDLDHFESLLMQFGFQTPL